MLALLNEYAEAQVEEIEAHGGHVLKFIGDGILAIFPDDETRRACERALDAAARLRRRIAALNERRAAAGLPVTDTHLALHVGELLYGNLGSPRRLDFTVLGPAVNEAARIEALCGSLEQDVIVSSAFAEAAGEARARAGQPRSLRDEGRRAAAGAVHAGSRRVARRRARFRKRRSCRSESSHGFTVRTSTFALRSKSESETKYRCSCLNQNWQRRGNTTFPSRMLVQILSLSSIVHSPIAKASGAESSDETLCRAIVRSCCT